MAGVSTGAAGAGVSTTGASTGLGAGFGPGRAAADLAGASVAGAAGDAAAALGASMLGAGADAAAAFSCSPYCFLKRISTGGSTVDDADLTNSPISLSFSRTNLLSTPNSRASSWTRVLATLLLLA